MDPLLLSSAIILHLCAQQQQAGPCVPMKSVATAHILTVAVLCQPAVAALESLPAASRRCSQAAAWLLQYRDVRRPHALVPETTS